MIQPGDCIAYGGKSSLTFKERGLITNVTISDGGELRKTDFMKIKSALDSQ